MYTWSGPNYARIREIKQCWPKKLELKVQEDDAEAEAGKARCTEEAEEPDIVWK